MTDDKLRALEAAVAELDNIVEMVETGGDIPTEITIVQNRLRAALAASATDEPYDPNDDPRPFLAASATEEWPIDYDGGSRLHRDALAASATDEGRPRAAGTYAELLASRDALQDDYNALSDEHDKCPAVPEALDHIAWAQQVRSDHEATHGEAEQCGDACVVLGLTEFEPAVPEALDVGRLAEAIWLVQHNTAADHYDRNVPPGSPHRADVDEVGKQVADEYEALSQREGERAYERGEDHP